MTEVGGHQMSAVRSTLMHNIKSLGRYIRFHLLTVLVADFTAPCELVLFNIKAHLPDLRQMNASIFGSRIHDISYSSSLQCDYVTAKHGLLWRVPYEV